MDSNLMLLAVSAGIVLLAVGVTAGLVTLYFRRQRAHLLSARTARELRRSAEHIHLVAQACHSHTGNADIGHALEQLAVATLENALRLTPRDTHVQQLLHEYQEQERAVRQERDEPACDASRHESNLTEDEITLSRARLLLTEAMRLLAQIERDGWIEQAHLQQMRDNLHQARRTTELRLRLRHAVPSATREQLSPQASGDEICDGRTDEVAVAPAARNDLQRLPDTYPPRPVRH